MVELDWSLVGLWLIQLFAVKEQIKTDSPPEQSSVALALMSSRTPCEIGRIRSTTRGLTVAGAAKGHLPTSQ